MAPYPAPVGGLEPVLVSGLGGLLVFVDVHAGGGVLRHIDGNLGGAVPVVVTGGDLQQILPGKVKLLLVCIAAGNSMLRADGAADFLHGAVVAHLPVIEVEIELLVVGGIGNTHIGDAAGEAVPVEIAGCSGKELHIAGHGSAGRGGVGKVAQLEIVILAIGGHAGACRRNQFKHLVARDDVPAVGVLGGIFIIPLRDHCGVKPQGGKHVRILALKSAGQVRSRLSRQRDPGQQPCHNGTGQHHAQ